jgi:hypothetical protein
LDGAALAVRRPSDFQDSIRSYEEGNGRRCPVRDQQWPDRRLDAQLFVDLAGSGLSGRLARFHIAAGDVSVILVLYVDWTSRIRSASSKNMPAAMEGRL